MMTGLLPYFNDDTEDLKNPESIKTLSQYRNDSYELSNEINEELREVLNKVFSKNINDRYDSISEMSKQINREKVIINQEHTIIESKQIIKKGNGFADVAGMEDLKNELVKMIDDKFNGNQNFKKIVMSSAFCSENDNIVSDNFKIDKKQTFGIIPPVGGG